MSWTKYLYNAPIIKIAVTDMSVIVSGGAEFWKNPVSELDVHNIVVNQESHFLRKSTHVNS